MSTKAKTISLSLLIGFLPSVGLAWAFAVTAADHVMAPHLARAKERVHIMCLWAQVSTDNSLAICKATGAQDCRTLDAKILLESCEEK
jgi:hypothetical protein